MNKQGDKVNELEFHAQEMKALRKTLPFKNNLSDKFILLLTDLSNNHGTRWWQAAILFFLSGAFFYSIILFVSGQDYFFGHGNLILPFLILLIKLSR